MSTNVNISSPSPSTIGIFNKSYDDVEKELNSVSNTSDVNNIKVFYTIIGELKRHVFHNFRNLIDLVLINCCIYKLENEVFHSLLNLKTINLSNNALNSINYNLFELNTKLETVILNNNLVETISKTAFSTLRRLESLDFSYNHISMLHEYCLNCCNLKKLCLNNNLIQAVMTTAFYQLPNLIYLTLEDNKITYIDRCTFQNSINLRTLNLNSNMIRKISYDTFWKLANLNSVCLRKNLLTQCIREHLFLYNPALIEIDLSENELSDIERFSFHACINLKTLSLKVCRQLDICSIRDIKTLSKFVLDYQVDETFILTRFFWDAIRNKSELKELSLSFKKAELKSLCSFSCLKNLQDLHIECKEPSLHAHNISFLTIFKNMPKLKKIIFKNVNRFFLTRFSSGENNLEYLDLTGLKNWGFEFFFKNFRSLRYLSFSYSDIEMFNSLAFEDLVNLEHLNLEHSKLKLIDAFLFENTINLQILNCSNCRIDTIEDYAFKNLKNLELLDLKNNFLRHVSENVFFGLNRVACQILLQTQN